VVASVLLLGGCTAVDDGAVRPQDAEPAPSTTTAPESPVTGDSPRAVVPRAPAGDGCYNLSLPELTRPSNADAPVRCSDRHNTQTIHVGDLDTVVNGHAVAVDSDHVRRQLADTCPRRLARHLGGSAEDRRLSRFEAVWFSPTLEQSDLGASWYRCDVVAFATQDDLFPLPPRRRLEGILDRPAGASYGLCGTAEPGAPDFSRVICARRHGWRALSTIGIAGGDRYPGVRAVRGAGEEDCRDRVRGRAADPLKFRYGWEWPTRRQWEAGQRFGYCWAPD
jgi:hypothetical protein